MTFDPTRWLGRRSALAALAIVAAFAVLWGIGYLLAADRTPAKASVLGVPIGGLPPAKAQSRLVARLQERVTAPVPVSVRGQRFTLDPVSAGLTVDAAASVAASGTGTWHPVSLVRGMLGGGPVDPVLRVDEAKLASALAGLVRRADLPAREGDVIFSGAVPVPVAPRPGLMIDQPAAAGAVRAAWLRSDAPIALSTQEIAPKVTTAEVDRALATLARPAVSAPIVLVAGRSRLIVPPATVAAALDFKPDSAARLQPVLDGPTLKRALATSLAAVEQRPKNAAFAIRRNKPVVVPAVDGRTVVPADLAAAVGPVLSKSGSARVASVAVRVRPADFSTREAQRLRIKEKLSTFQQPFPYAAYRVQNIGRAARYINGTVLRPGETFSMNRTVKERTAANGYTVGTVISRGRFREEYGGGVSTITTAMWTAAFYAGLERVEQRAHSFFISRYAPGLEATVAWGALDLKFRNDSPQGVLIQASSGTNSVTITMWGTKQYDVSAVFGPRTHHRRAETIYDPGRRCVPQEGVDGFDIVVTRVFKQGGQVVRREPLRTTYNAADQIYCRPEPQTAAPSPRPPSAAEPSPSPAPRSSSSPSSSPKPKPRTTTSARPS